MKSKQYKVSLTRSGQITLTKFLCQFVSAKAVQAPFLCNIVAHESIFLMA